MADKLSERDDFKTSCEFYRSVAIVASKDLRKVTGLDETSFGQIASALWRDPRPAFIYRVLDEVQKAGISIIEWVAKLLASDDKPDYSDHDSRLVNQWIQDEQSFRARKLIEILVELVCFSKTNEPEYYRDYLRLRELDVAVRSLADQKEFFGFQRRNTEHHVAWLTRDIVAAEKNKIDPAQRWYLREKERTLRPKWQTTGVPFSSFRYRYKFIFNQAFPSELAAIGKSYVHAYGMSEDIHFAAQQTSSDFKPDDIYLGVHRVGLLCFAAIIRCQHLLDIVPEGLNSELREIHDTNTGPAEIIGRLSAAKINVGDFVWASGDICEVLESKKSKYGYLSFRVRFLERPPIPEIKDDWFASFEVRLVAERSFVEKAIASFQTDPDIDAETKLRFREMKDIDRASLMSEAVVRLWRAQEKLINSA